MTNLFCGRLEFGSYAKDFVERGPETRTLAAICDTLLPKLISGELRVEHANSSRED